MAENNTKPFFFLNPLEQLAANTVNKAYTDNKLGWRNTHDKFRRLYNFVRMNQPQKGQTVLPNRSALRVGMAWMVIEIMHATTKSVLLGNAKIGELVDIADNPVNYADEMLAMIHKQIMDSDVGVEEKLSDALWDAIALGHTTLIPNWRRIIKRVFQDVPQAVIDPLGRIGEQMITQELEKVVYAGPEFDVVAPWNVFPTRGIKDFKEAHEVIIRIENMPLHQMRQFERDGIFDRGKVDEFVKMVGTAEAEQDIVSSLTTVSQREKTEPDAEGTHDVLVYYGLFPLNQFGKFVDNEGIDRSKDEVQTLIIKPINYDIIFKVDRNPYYNQEQPVIAGGYFQVPGEPWFTGPIEISEDLFTHYNNWFNIIQDGANLNVYPDEIRPTNADGAQSEQDGPSQIHYATAAQIAIGGHFKRMYPTGNIMAGAYEQLNITQSLIQEVTGIVDLVRGMASGKTATEIEEIADRVNIRFRERSLFMEKHILRPALNWILSLNAQFHTDTDWLMSMMAPELGFNPFSLIDPVMPNNMTRWKLTGAIRAADTIQNRRNLEHIIALSLQVPPGPDENGELKGISTMALLIDLIKLSDLPDSEKYIVPADQLPPPELAPSLQGGSDPANPKSGNIPSNGGGRADNIVSSMFNRINSETSRTGR